jgi:hypothetical protein
VEAILFGNVPSWKFKDVFFTWLLVIVLPWVSVAIYLYLMPYPRRAVVTATGLPVVYALVFIVGATIGDVSGLIPQ